MIAAGVILLAFLIILAQARAWKKSRTARWRTIRRDQIRQNDTIRITWVASEQAVQIVASVHKLMRVAPKNAVHLRLSDGKYITPEELACAVKIEVYR